MKRIVCLVAVLLAVSGMLSAGAQKQGGGTVINFAYWNPEQQPGYDKVVDLYQKASGNRVVTTITPWAQYQTKVQTMISAGEDPDVYRASGAMSISWFPAGMALDLTDLIQRDNVDMSMYPSANVAMQTVNGRIYGLPNDYETIGLFYNKAIFDAKGVPYPTNDWTWDDLRRAAERLTDGTVHGFNATHNSIALTIPWIYNGGGPFISQDRRHYSLNDPATIAALRELKRYIDDGLSPTQASAAEMDSTTRFQAGLVAMITGGSFSLPGLYDALGEDLGVARFPYKPGMARTNNTNGAAIAVGPHTKIKEEAWAFAKTFASVEAATFMADVVIPAVRGADAVWAGNWPSLPDLKLVFIDASAYAKPHPSPTVNMTVQRTIMEGYMDLMLRGDIDIAEGVAAIDRECLEAIKQ